MRGILKGDTEKTDTDRKRQRREKKHKQHLKYVRQEQKLSDKVKKAGVEGKKLDKESSAKLVQNAIKSGKVKKVCEMFQCSTVRQDELVSFTSVCNFLCSINSQRNMSFCLASLIESNN